MFSRFSRALENNDAVTVLELLRVCQGAYSPAPAVEEMKFQINFKDKILQDSELLGYKELPGISDPLAFKFVKGVDGNVGVLVKRKHSDTMWLNEMLWEGVEQDEQQTEPHRLIKSSVTAKAFFTQFPSSTTKAIDPVELSAIRDTVENCPRIDNNVKLQQLRWAIDELAEDRVETFAWELGLYGVDSNVTVSEIQSQMESSNSESSDDQLEAETTFMAGLGPQVLVSDIRSTILYTMGTMVLVRPNRDYDKKSPFWLARVLRDVPIPEKLHEVPTVEVV